MKLNLVATFLLVSGAFAADVSSETKKTPDQLRANLRHKLQENGRDSGAGGDGGDTGAGGDGGDTGAGGDGGDTGAGGDGGDTGGSGGGSSSCFSAFNNVEVQGEGMVAMDSIKVGDYVRSSSNDFSRVFSLAHVDHDFETDFIQLYSEGIEKPLEITGVHMVYVSGKPIRADEVTVGDMLGKNKVSEIKSVKRTGVYAPVTESGDIVVNGVRSSSYYAFLDNSPLNQHGLSHLFFAPHRLMCSFNFESCKNEGHTNGYTNWAYWAIKLMEMSNEYIAPVQWVLPMLALPFLSAAYCAEQAIMSPFTFLFAIGYMLHKKNGNKSKA